MLAILAAVVLTAGATIEADLKGGEVHAYEMDLAAGMYFAAHFDQRGIDIRSVIVGPDGSTVFDLDTREWGDEPAVIVARTAGRYRLEARTIEQRAPRGHYVLHVDALRTATPADEESASAMALQSRGWIALKRGGKDNVLQARELYVEARTAFQSVGNRVGEADAVTALGFIANVLDDFRSAGAFDEQDIELRRAIGDEYGETRAMVNHARMIRTLGDAPDTIGIFEAALARHRAAGRAGNAADVLGQLSMTARSAGDYGAAIEYGYQAVALSRTIGDPAREAEALTAIGPVHLELGELEQAIDVYHRARRLAPEDETLKALADSQIGLALVRQGQFDAAEQSLNAGLAVWTARGWRAYESNTLRYFGELFAARGDTARAGDAFQRAAATAHDTGYAFGEALALRQAAEAMLLGGRLDDADRALATAAALFPEADELAQAIIQTDRAKLALARSDLPAARTSAEAAVRAVESLRGRAASARIRGAMLASSQTTYSTLIDVLMAQHAARPSEGFDREAFDVAERARARSLLELLLDDRVAGAGESGPLALLRDFHRRLNAKARALDDARRAKNEALTARLARELDELTDQYALAEARVRRDNPEALGDSEPASLASIQRSVLDAGTVLVEFSLGEKASYGWMVTQSSVSTARLAPRSEIEEAARTALDAIQRRRPSADTLLHLQRLLLQPLGPLPEQARLLIVTTGALQQVPFAALPDGRGRGPLVMQHEIVHTPSASVLAAVRAASGTRVQAPHTAAVFADPVFDADDPRAQRASHAVAAAGVPGLPGSTVRSGLARLPFTRLEADAIAALVPRSSLLLATGFDASIKTVSTQAIADYRIVHFATHGVLDTRTPELSGLALSMIDREGRRQDGFLRMHDVSALHLNADLVVLSGCETALGRSVDGEGVIGLTRGFVLAGASRVIASLWRVDDRATAELMTQLYREMLEHGKTPAAALAAAQRSLAASTQWRDPFFWAGLVIQGEWR